jgi:alpha-methylacyl-CoA racemase
MAYVLGLRAAGEWSDVRGENLLDGSAPWYGVYETADGRYISVAASEPQFYARLLNLLGLDVVSDLPDRSDPSQWAALSERFEHVFRQRTRAEWCERLEGSDACFAPVLDIGEAISHPHNQARGTFVNVDGVVQPAPAPRFSRTTTARPRPPGLPGKEDVATLASWGLGSSEVESLKRNGAFGRARDPQIFPPA